MPIKSFSLLESGPPIALERQLRPPIHRPVWSPSEEAVLIVSQGLGDEHMLAGPITVAEDKQGFQMAWAQRPDQVSLTELDDARRNHTVRVAGASASATHYWVLLWSSWVPPLRRTRDRPFHHPLETATTRKTVILETEAVETALQALWRPDGHPGLIAIRPRPWPHLPPSMDRR
jgi:hypothetical protein